MDFCKQAQKNWADFGQVAHGVSNGQSEIRIDKLEFHRPRNVASQYGFDEGWTGLVQAVIFEVNDRDKIGYSSPDGYRYCCTKELVPKTKCHLNRLIYQVRASHHLLSIQLHTHVSLTTLTCNHPNEWLSGVHRMSMHESCLYTVSKVHSASAGLTTCRDSRTTWPSSCQAGLRRQ